MATSPVNGRQHHQQSQNHQHQPLHNFSLSFLKWGNKSHVNSFHRSRRSTPPPEQPRSQYARRSESRDMVDDSGRFGAHEDHRAARIRVDFASVSVEEKLSRSIEYDDQKEDEEGREREEEYNREEAQKIWNLRPRKNAAVKNGYEIGTSGGVGSVGGLSKDVAVHVNSGAVEKKKKEKMKLWISLSKEEIEEDIFIMTGSRPARKPKRRPKSLQKQLDSVFPGLGLLGATADTFKIPDTPPKK
uniref:Uncharacterized protein n=1 Tax=Kalanchoe fedtschenkoi TaxID=63787 RepID=A0A7N0TZZ4_KALFE